jgi:multiple sugar transport system permease protein
MAAASVLTDVPTMVVFALVSRWIIERLTSGAVKV